MKVKGNFEAIGTRTISGKRFAVARHKRLAYFRIGTCNIPARTIDEAIDKFAACQARRALAEKGV